jgi:N-acetylated-alpha-linked acidic dipeptidase
MRRSCPSTSSFYGENIRQFVKEIHARKEVGRNLDLKPLLSRVAEFESSGREVKHAVTKALATRQLNAASSSRINRRLKQVESNWLNEEGIPGRPWFKHTLYAARFTYAHLELPGLTEAVEQADWRVAKEQVRILERALAKNAALLRDARMELESDGDSSRPAR